MRDVRRWSPDVVYLRHGLVHPGLITLAGRIPCVVEVNGNDLAEFRSTSSRRYLLARATRGLLLRRAAGLVFVTHELAAMPTFAVYGRPAIVIANGIDLSGVEPAPAPANEAPRLVFVGHPHTPWHGVDHLESIAAGHPDWRIDIIGPGPDEVSAATPNVTAHGPLAPAEYRQLLVHADVAIGSLALYRAGISEASTLKVREYLAAGLPVIVGYRDTDFPEGAPFILSIPNEPSGIRSSAKAIEGFVNAWRGRRVPRPEVSHLDVTAKESARCASLRALPVPDEAVPPLPMTVVIVTWNSAEVLPATLRSVAEADAEARGDDHRGQRLRGRERRPRSGMGSRSAGPHQPSDREHHESGFRRGCQSGHRRGNAAVALPGEPRSPIAAGYARRAGDFADHRTRRCGCGRRQASPGGR